MLRAVILLGLFWGSVYPEAFSSQVTDQIRIRLESDQPGKQLEIQGASLKSSAELHRFYGNRQFEEVWSKDGVLTELAYAMRFEIYQSKFDGLNPNDYNIEALELFFSTFESNKKKKEANNPGQVADLDLLLSDAFFHLASHLEAGKIDPSTLNSRWDIISKSKKLDYSKLLTEAYQTGEVRKQLEKLYPDFTIYKKGREVLRALDERRKTDTLNWKRLKVDKSIKVGDENNSIPTIRQRLIFWGYLPDYKLTEEKLYDSTMWVGVKKFQQSNGMEVDGVIGRMTGEALDASPADLMDKAAVNLERLRWLPDPVKSGEFILVNIANYELDFLSDSDTLFSSRVIVGKEYHQSPIFSAEMSYIVFSPYWNIPYSITKNEIMPAVRRNSNYLSQKNMEVVTHGGNRVDPSSVNWSSKSFPYLIRQKPGAGNSLGLVKFMFPNKYSVYIHDTPTRNLFEKKDRALSHGCIRLENPAKLAELLLKNDPSWTAERIDQAMHQSKEKIVNLDRKIPVILLYLTFWADSNGKGHFRPDVYGRDAEMIEALR